MKNNYSLTIGWLYPQLMSTYGDQGNIIVLQKRCEWRGIEVSIVTIDQFTTETQLKTIDLLFGGGAQDKEQEIVIENLMKKKKAIQELIEKEIPALFVCGAPQLMGKYYEPAVGKRMEGMGIFDMVTKHPGTKQDRLIGNLVAQINWKNLISPDKVRNETIKQSPKTLPKIASYDDLVVGFENHGGRTYLGKTTKSFAKVIKGYGNNGEDGSEGVIYKNAIGCYLHGPLLPKNPQIADWLISKALEVKYKKISALKPLDDTLEEKAKSSIANRLGVEV